MVSHYEVIAAFGGPRPLAAAIGIDPALSTHWVQRGIPAKHWHKVVNVAVARIPTLTIDDLERTKPTKVTA